MPGLRIGPKLMDGLSAGRSPLDVVHPEGKGKKGKGRFTVHCSDAVGYRLAIGRSTGVSEI